MNKQTTELVTKNTFRKVDLVKIDVLKANNESVVQSPRFTVNKHRLSGT